MNARGDLAKIASILAHCKGLPSDNPEDWDWCATTPKVERARILAMADQSREWSRTLSVRLREAVDRITPAMSQSAAAAWADCEARDLNHRQAGIYLHMLAKPWAGALRIKRIWQHLGLDPDDGVDIMDVLDAFGCRGPNSLTWFSPRGNPPGWVDTDPDLPPADGWWWTRWAWNCEQQIVLVSDGVVIRGTVRQLGDDWKTFVRKSAGQVWSEPVEMPETEAWKEPEP